MTSTPHSHQKIDYLEQIQQRNFSDIMAVIKSSFKANPIRRHIQMGIISDSKKISVNQWPKALHSKK